jgi:hypothetical protein
MIIANFRVHVIRGVTVKRRLSTLRKSKTAAEQGPQKNRGNRPLPISKSRTRRKEVERRSGATFVTRSLHPAPRFMSHALRI